MPAARHIVRRLVFEITAPRRRCEVSLIEYLSRLIQARFGSTLDSYCSSLVSEDSHCRIDRLELDLGPLRLERLEADLTNALARSLRQQLSGATSASKARPTDPITAHEELIEHFLVTGVLPWWVGSETSPSFEESLAYLRQHSRDRLIRLLDRLADAPVALPRLILRTPDAILSPLHREILGPAHQLLDTLWTEFREAPPPTTPSVAEGLPALGNRRVALWRSALITALRLGPSTRPPIAWFRSLLAELAASSGVPIPRWIASLRAACRADGPLGHPEWQGLLLTSAPSPPSTPSALSVLLLRHLDRLAAASRARWLAEFGWDTAGVEVEGPLSSEEVRALIQIFEAAVSEGSLTTAELRAASASWFGREPGSAALEALRAWVVNATVAVNRPACSSPRTKRLPEISPTRLPAHLAFGDAEEVHLANAGLVLLWPFLPTFLAHLGRTESGRFADARAQHRSAGLLQFLATGDPAPREEDLTLAKVLCGIPVEEVFDFGAPVTEAEQRESESLLAAVVQQAPSLGSLSVAGFRRAFLSRNGQLSSREGCWLLRVERQTYDVVLERLPWAFRWIKLSWMADALQVEW